MADPRRAQENQAFVCLLLREKRPDFAAALERAEGELLCPVCVGIVAKPGRLPEQRHRPSDQALTGRWRRQPRRQPDGLYLGLDGCVGGLVAAREGLQRGEGGRSGLADGQLGAALVSLDQSPGGRGGRRRERDLQQALVKPALGHRLCSQGHLGGGEISMFMVGVTLYLGVEEAVGRLGCCQSTRRRPMILGAGLAALCPADDPRGCSLRPAGKAQASVPATRRASG